MVYMTGNQRLRAILQIRALFWWSPSAFYIIFILKHQKLINCFKTKHFFIHEWVINSGLDYQATNFLHSKFAVRASFVVSEILEKRRNAHRLMFTPCALRKERPWVALLCSETRRIFKIPVEHLKTTWKGSPFQILISRNRRKYCNCVNRVQVGELMIIFESQWNVLAALILMSGTTTGTS